MLGSIKVTSEVDRSLVLEGRDDKARTWKASVPSGAGAGFTDVWQADFDQNGRNDLLIAAYSPINGRCVERITLTFLLFDGEGRPSPWVTKTQMPFSKKEPHVPALFGNALQSGGLQLISTGCEYSEYPRVGEDRSITGIYVARNAIWTLVRPSELKTVVETVRKKYQFRKGKDEWIDTDPNEWTDQGNSTAATPASAAGLKAVLPASPDCRGVRIPIGDGQLVPMKDDPCDVLGKNRIELLDGTVCLGWPVTVIDRPGGREIVAEPDRIRASLQELADTQISVVLSGQTNSKRCSPAMIWATVQ